MQLTLKLKGSNFSTKKKKKHGSNKLIPESLLSEDFSYLVAVSDIQSFRLEH